MDKPSHLPAPPERPREDCRKFTKAEVAGRRGFGYSDKLGHPSGPGDVR
jgi:hypothetical protein